MSQPEASDSPFSSWIESSAPPNNDLEAVRLSAARARGMEEANAALARQLNGPMTALLIYIGEIKQHSHLSRRSRQQAYLQQVVDNAMEQTERVCRLVKQLADNRGERMVTRRNAGRDGAPPGHGASRRPGAMLSSAADRKPLTKREREVLGLISEGYSNKQGALRMGSARGHSKVIGPKPCESSARETPRISFAWRCCIRLCSPIGASARAHCLIYSY